MVFEVVVVLFKLPGVADILTALYYNSQMVISLSGKDLQVVFEALESTF